MQVYTFDFICECQDFNHNEEFVLKEDLDSEMESKQKELTTLKDREKKLVEVVKFIEKMEADEEFPVTRISKSAKLCREVLKELGVE